MANLAGIKIPMTEKPVTEFTQTTSSLYIDIFNIQNTIRILMDNLVEEAPQDGNKYVRQNGKWVLA